MTENASRSTNGRKEHRLVPSKCGSMSIRLSTKYTVVPRLAASESIGLSGWTKCDTSAMSGMSLHHHPSLTNTGFDVTIGQLSRVQGVINVLAAYIQLNGGSQLTRRINTADYQIPQILTIPPLQTIGSLFRYHPFVALFWQTIQNGLSKRPVGHLVFQQQTLLLCLFALHLTQGSDKMTIGIPRMGRPRINRHQNLLINERRCLARSQSNPREGSRQGRGKYRLLRQGGESSRRKRRPVEVAHVAGHQRRCLFHSRSPVSLDHTNDLAGRQHIPRLSLCLFVHLHLQLCLGSLRKTLVVFRIIVSQRDYRSAYLYQSLTILINDLFPWGLPFGLWENLHHHHVPVHGSVHILPTHKQNCLVEPRHIDSPLASA